MGKLFDSPTLVVVLLVAVIVIFGSKRLPDAARGVGRSLRIFKAETKGLMSDEEQAAQQVAPVAAPQPVVQPVTTPVAQPQPVTPVAPPVQPQPAVTVPVQPQAVPSVQQPVPPAAPVNPEADQHQA